MTNPQRFLAMYSGLLTLVLVAILIAGWRFVKTARFDKIEVRRIDVVEPDGTLRLVISGSARAPGVIIRGKEFPHPDERRSAGMLFFNDEGTEQGGLIFDGAKDPNGRVRTSGHLSFDQYLQDQMLVLQSSQDDGGRENYIEIVDRPDYPITDLMALLQQTKSLPLDQRQKKLDAFLASRGRAHPRLFLGRREDRSVVFNLKDPEGRDRLVAKVGADGTPVLQLLDETGRVTNQLPPAKE